MRLGSFLIFLFVVLIPGVERWVELDATPWLDAQLKGLDRWRPPTVCRVEDRHGQVVDEFSLVRRIWVPLDTLPDHVWEAFVAAEDRRFFEHGGVDLLGIARAISVNLAAGEIREGGSTLTQQLVKNVVVGKQKSYVRKLKEAGLAWRLEQKVDKRRILELYLNYVYLGSGNYGVEAAAQDYFGVHAAQLDAGQAAMIAGLIPAPTAYSPRRSREVARERRRIVLDGMVDAGFVDVLDGQILKRAPIDPPVRTDGTTGTGMAFFTNVRREVRRLLGEEIPFQAGLTVKTAYDPAVQAAAESAIEAAARAVEERQGHRGPRYRLAGEGLRAFLERADGLQRDEAGDLFSPQVGDCFPAAYVGRGKVMAGTFTLAFTPAAWTSRVRNPDTDDPPGTVGTLARWGDVWDVCVEAKGRVAPKREPWVQGAVVVLDQATGGVVAMVGGRDMELEGFNRATQAERQAGSSFKPYVYAAALEHGHTQIDTVLDGPISMTGSNGRPWSPQNYTGEYKGHLPMRSAFAQSLNTVAVRLALETGVDAIADTARRLGVQSKLRRDVTLALGSSEVTVMDQAVGVSALVRGGVPIDPVYVLELVDLTGTHVGRAGEAVALPGVDVVLPGAPKPRGVSAGTAWQLVEMMRGVVQEGTGRKARAAGKDRGGKTGTSSDYADAWFVGWIPAATTAVWLGQDDRAPLGNAETGGKAALPVFLKVVEALGEPVGSRLHPPPEVLELRWHGVEVGLPADGVPPALLPWKDPGEAPLPDFPGPDVRPCTTTASR